MPSNQAGVCLPLKHCPNLNKLANRKHLSSADRQFLKRSFCGRVGRTPLVCCSQPKEQQPPKKQQQLQPQTQQSQQFAARLSGSPIQKDDLPKDCGQTEDIFNQDAYSIEYLIVGGKESRIGDSPWLALLQYEKRKFHRIDFRVQSIRNINCRLISCPFSNWPWIPLWRRFDQQRLCFNR